MRLIVNADDFGLSKGVNAGILETYRHGIVRSTTLMANARAFDDAAGLALENPGLGCGVHLVLTAGVPLVPGHSTLVGPEGRFHSQDYLLNHESTYDPGELEREFAAQIEKVAGAGVRITHIDTHHHVHELDVVVEVVIRLAKRYGLPVRPVCPAAPRLRQAEIPTPDSFTDGFYKDSVSASFIAQAVRDFSGGTLEIMCHPGYVDAELYQCSSYHLGRTVETAVLTDDVVKRFMDENGVELINYSQL